MSSHQKHENLILKILPTEDKIEYTLAEGKLSLLAEAGAGVNEEDLTSLKTSVTDARKKLNKLVTALEETPLAENDAFTSYLEKLNDALVKSERAVVEIELTDDPASIQATLGEIIAIESRVTSFLQSFEKAFTVFSKALTPAVPKDKLDEPIESLSEEPGSKVPDVSKLGSGFNKAMTTAAADAKKSESGGLLQRFGKWLKGIFSGRSSATKKALADLKDPPSPGDLLDSVLKMSLNQINSVVKSLKTLKFQAPPEDATDRLVAALRARAEKKSAESEKGGEGEKEASAPESAASDEDIVKSIDDPRAAEFIKALRADPNTRALFEEGLMIRESFYNSRLASLLFEAPIKYEDILNVAKKIVDDDAAQKKLAISAAKAFKEKKKKEVTDIPEEASKDESEAGKEKTEEKPDDKTPEVFSRKAWLEIVSDISNNPEKQQNFVDQLNGIAGKKILEGRGSDAVSNLRWTQLAGLKNED